MKSDSFKEEETFNITFKMLEIHCIDSEIK